MQKETEFRVLHITNGTIFLHYKIIRVVVGIVVIVFGELIVSWVPRCRQAFSSLPLKIQVVLLFQLVQSLTVLPGGQQSDTCSEEEYQPYTWWFLVGRCAASTHLPCVFAQFLIRSWSAELMTGRFWLRHPWKILKVNLCPGYRIIQC